MRREFAMKFFAVILALTYSTSVNAQTSPESSIRTLKLENVTTSSGDKPGLNTGLNTGLNDTGLNTTGLNTTRLNTTGLNTTGLNTTRLNTTGLNTTGLNTTGLNTTNGGRPIVYSINNEAKGTLNNTRSIVFVVDSTANLANFKTGISNDFGNFNNDNHYTYSLIQFDDEDAALEIENGNLDSIDHTLRDLKRKNRSNSTCTVQSLKGIQEGLKVSSNDSFIVVLTNGEPDQSHQTLMTEILATIAEKRIRVYFASDGGCNNKLSFIPEYQKIAAVGNGQIYEMQSHSSTGELLDLLMNSTRVDLLAVDRLMHPIKLSENYEVFVDETITEILISAPSPKALNLKVIEPSGAEFKNLNKSYDPCPSFSYIRICRLQKPRPGKWIITVTVNVKNTVYSLRVSAISSMKIHFGFDDQSKPPKTNLTFCQPRPGIENYFFAKLDELSPNTSVSSAKIISKEGNVRHTFNLIHDNATQNLYSGQFPLNNSDATFHLQINGKTNGNQTFQRITAVAFGNYSSNFNRSRHCALPYMPHEKPESPAPTTTSTTPSPTPPKSNPGHGTKNVTTPAPGRNDTSSTPKPKKGDPGSKPNSEPKTAGSSSLTVVLTIIGVIIILVSVVIALMMFFKPGATYPVQRRFLRNRSVPEED